MRVELNLCYSCQCACAGCDRLCGIVPNNDEVTVDQVKGVLAEAWEQQIHIERVKALGGEPALHSHLTAIVQELLVGVEQDIVGGIKIDTNGIKPLPADLPRHPQLKIGGRKPKKKIHLPFLWSPSDLGLAWHGPCSHPYKCGFSFDSRGWLPCSPAVMIDRLFYGGEHYRQEISTVPWATDLLCRHCVYAAPAEWRQRMATPIGKFTPEMRMPTRSWAEALKRAGVDVPKIYDP